MTPKEYDPHLEGKPVTLQYLPTKDSRKWRNALYRPAYSMRAHLDAQALAAQDNWHDWRYIEGMQL